MGKIGEYIHAHYQNYLMLGLSSESISNKKSVWTTSDFQAQQKNFLTRVKKNENKVLTPTEKKEMRDFLYSFMNPKKDDKIAREARKFIKEELKTKFNDSIQNINFSFGNVKNTKYTQALQELREKEKEAKAILQKLKMPEKCFNVANIQNKINAIQTYINGPNFNVSKKAKSKIQKELTLIEKQLEPLIKELNGKKTLEITDLNRNTLEGLLNKTNDLLQTYFSLPATNLQKGDLFEYIIALTKIKANGLGMKELNNGLKKAKENIKGDKKSSVEIDLGNINNEVAQLLRPTNYRIDKDQNTLISIKTSQEKIDVELNWKGKDIAISAKNINLSSPNAHINILSGSSLLYLLQDEDTNFINHYLNITATHADKEPSPLLIASAHASAKAAVVVKALSGATFKRKQATTFIANDNSKKGKSSIQIYDIYDMLEIATKDMQSLNNYTQVKTGNNKWGKDLSTIRFQNNIIGSTNNTEEINDNNAAKRIANLLIDMHKKKIYVALSPTLLSNPKLKM